MEAAPTELYQTAFFETDLPAAADCITIKQNSPKNDWYTFHFKVKNNGEKMGLTVAPSNIAVHIYIYLFIQPRTHIP